MSSLLIEGGIRLSGKISTAGNKNAVLPMIAAALLTDETIFLENVPDIGDVRTMLQLAEAVGVTIAWDRDARTLSLSATQISNTVMPRKLCQDIRAGILFVAPMLHRAGQVTMFPPGGDVIGRRRVDSHFHGLLALGAKITTENNFVFKAPQQLTGNDIFLAEASVTATAQTLMAATLAQGTTIIRNAASEPHIEDLAIMLNKMGASIEGHGSNTLTVRGVSSLHGTNHRVVSDHTEAGSFLALAAATGGEVTVSGIDPRHYRMIGRTFERFGVALRFGRNEVTVTSDDARTIKPDLGGGIPVIDDGPWPHFPSDLMSVMIVLATQTPGTVLFFEKMYESRMYFVDRLVSMGANAVICDPHRVVISGPAALHGIELSSPDIRAGMALVGAALCAQGKSIIRNIRLIDRGYERIDEKLRSLGARIKLLAD